MAGIARSTESSYGEAALEDKFLRNFLITVPVLIGISVASYYLYLDYHPVPAKAGDLAASNSGKNLEIKIKDNVVKGTGADVKIKTGMDNQASIEVAKGKATLTDKNKKSVVLGQAERAGFDEKGIGAVNKIAVI